MGEAKHRLAQLAKAVALTRSRAPGFLVEQDRRNHRAEIAARAEKEIRYHLRHNTQWLIRLGDGTDESHRKAQEAIDDSPNEWAMVGDLFVARPIGVVLTAGGTAAWLVSLPFTLLAGHAGEAAETLIVGPGAATFMRCLGCRETGYTYKDVEQIRKARGDDEEAAEG